MFFRVSGLPDIHPCRLKLRPDTLQHQNAAKTTAAAFGFCGINWRFKILHREFKRQDLPVKENLISCRLNQRVNKIHRVKS